MLTCLPATLAAPVQRSGAQNILQSSDLFHFQAQPPLALTAQALATSIYRRANLVRLRLIDSWPDWPLQVGCRRADREIPGVTHVDVGGVIATATTPGCVVVSLAVILPLKRLISAEWTYG